MDLTLPLIMLEQLASYLTLGSLLDALTQIAPGYQIRSRIRVTLGSLPLLSQLWSDLWS